MLDATDPLALEHVRAWEVSPLFAIVHCRRASDTRLEIMSSPQKCLCMEWHHDSAGSLQHTHGVLAVPAMAPIESRATNWRVTCNGHQSSREFLQI
ncbi:MAG: hypothetical protein F4Z55_04550 [Boseongicola sp. SB0667_bin_21]|nr:hypothetical protein [Boseongicola sp.]MXW85204.1 hypothetical protein [Boseongicola sp. SB0667_bin_21]